MSSPDAPALFYAALTVSAPTFGWVVAGLLLRRVGLLTEPVINRVSQLAFRYGLNIGMGWPLRHIGGTKHYDRALSAIAVRLDTHPATVANWVELAVVTIGAALFYI